LRVFVEFIQLPKSDFFGLNFSLALLFLCGLSSALPVQAQAKLKGARLSKQSVAVKPVAAPGKVGIDNKSIERWRSGNLSCFRLKVANLFDPEQARLTPAGEKLLRQLKEAMVPLGKHSGFIWCYSDGIGFDAFQRDLTLKRAQQVRTFLLNELVAVDSYSCRGWGKERPESYSGIVGKASVVVLPPGRHENIVELIVDLLSSQEAKNSTFGAQAGGAVVELKGREDLVKNLGLQPVSESLHGAKEDGGGDGRLGLQVRPGQGLVVPKEEFGTVIPHEKVGQERSKMTPEELKKLEEEEKRRLWEQNEFGVWREQR
jgi:outer membrane protein OmpA-like peptidoglycan-associated protein